MAFSSSKSLIVRIEGGGTSMIIYGVCLIGSVMLLGVQYGLFDFKREYDLYQYSTNIKIPHMIDISISIVLAII